MSDKTVDDTQHIADERLVAYATRTLTPDELAAIERHLASCEDCRRRAAHEAHDAATLAPATDPMARTEHAASGPGAAAESYLAPGTVVGRYRIVAYLAEGGMGVIYRAHDPELDRVVALKLVRGSGHGVEGDEMRRRLAREAQAMARLSSPHVVAVYDVGTFGDEVFVAMELVEGTTLTRWLREGKRSWRAILDVFIAAGRGLAAAHGAGLVHRDFKPDNVLVGSDGRVRVSDFGLARTSIGGEGGDGPLADAMFDLAASPVSAGSPLDRTLSRPGAVAGTPAYMPPEQLAGEPADARSDVFSYCAALYEALHGVRAFHGATIDELARAIREHKIQEGKRHDAPLWLEKVVRKGLAATPAERYPSMSAVLDALDRGPRRRRIRLAALACVALVAAGLGAQRLVVARRKASCRVDGSRFAGVWDAARRKLVEDAFLKTGRPSAKDSFATVAEDLDDYRSRWIRMRTEACEATRVRRQQSEELLVRRYRCFDDRMAEFRSVIDELSRADPALVDHAPSFSMRVGLRECNNLSMLMLGQARPTDAATVAKLDRVDEATAYAMVLSRLGRYRQALAVIEPRLDEARAAGFPPSLARALHEAAVSHALVGEPERALDLAHQSILASLDGGRDDLVAANFSYLGWILGSQLRRPEGLRDLDLSGAFIRRLDNAPSLEAQRLAYRVSVLTALGRPAEAIAIAPQAIKLREEVEGSDSALLAELLVSVGRAYNDGGRPEDAIPVLGRAIAIMTAIDGRDSPAVGNALLQRGFSYGRLHRGPESLADIERTLQIREANYGLDSPLVVENLVFYGGALGEVHRGREAIPYLERAVATADRIDDPYPDAINALTNLAGIHRELGDPAASVAAAERAIAHRGFADLSPGERASVELELGESLWLVGKERARAVEIVRRAADGFAHGEAGTFSNERQRAEAWLATHH